MSPHSNLFFCVTWPSCAALCSSSWFSSCRRLSLCESTARSTSKATFCRDAATSCSRSDIYHLACQSPALTDRVPLAPVRAVRVQSLFVERSVETPDLPSFDRTPPNKCEISRCYEHMQYPCFAQFSLVMLLLGGRLLVCVIQLISDFGEVDSQLAELLVSPKLYACFLAAKMIPQTSC